MQNTVKTSTSFIQIHKDSISQTISQSTAMQGIQNFSCNSTSLCPSREPQPVSLLLTAFQDLYKNINGTLETALTVGEDFEALDKKLGDSSDKLNYTLTSTKAPNVPVLQYDDQIFDYVTTDEVIDQAEKIAQEKNIDIDITKIFTDGTTINSNSNTEDSRDYDAANIASVAAGGLFAGIASSTPIGAAPSTPAPSAPTPSTPGSNSGTTTSPAPTQGTDTEDKNKDEDKDENQNNNQEQEQEKDHNNNQEQNQEKEEDNLDKLPTLEEEIEQKEEIEKSDSEIQEEKPQSTSQTSQGGIYNPTKKPKNEKPNTNVKNENESEIIGPQKPVDTDITPNDDTGEIIEPEKPIDTDIDTNDESSEILPPIIEIKDEVNPQKAPENVNTSNESTSNIGTTLGVASLVGAAVGGAAYALHKKKENDYSYNEEYNEDDNNLEDEGGEQIDESI